jgi:uncharacterized membrane protein YqjE
MFNLLSPIIMPIPQPVYEVPNEQLTPLQEIIMIVLTVILLVITIMSIIYLIYEVYLNLKETNMCCKITTKILSKIIIISCHILYKKINNDILYIKGIKKDYPKYVLYTEKENTK